MPLRVVHSANRPVVVVVVVCGMASMSRVVLMGTARHKCAYMNVALKEKEWDERGRGRDMANVWDDATNCDRSSCRGLMRKCKCILGPQCTHTHSLSMQTNFNAIHNFTSTDVICCREHRECIKRLFITCLAIYYAKNICEFVCVYVVAIII